jgi:hypothetical protein
MSYTINTLMDDWRDALWAEMLLAYDRDHMDANHDLAGDYDRRIEAGVDAYLADLYSTRFDGECRLTWMDDEVDALSRETEWRARLAVSLRDQGLVQTIYMKVRGPQDGAE